MTALFIIQAYKGMRKLMGLIFEFTNSPEFISQYLRIQSFYNNMCYAMFCLSAIDIINCFIY